MTVLPIAILAGGLGTRIQSVSRGLPKSLMEFNGKPFLEWQLQLLEKNKCKAVVICVGHKSDLIKKSGVLIGCPCVFICSLTKSS